jgi:hypothetical protein
LSASVARIWKSGLPGTLLPSRKARREKIPHLKVWTPKN